MVGKSDVFLVIGAVVLFSMLLLNMNGYLFSNQKAQVSNELEFTGVALAQDVIDQARWKSFDELSQFNGYEKIDTTQNGIYTVRASVIYVDRTNAAQSGHSATDYRRLTVTVQNQLLDYPIRLSYIKAR